MSAGSSGLSEEDLLLLAGTGRSVQSTAEPLAELSRQILEQYVQVFADFASEGLNGRVSRKRVNSTTSALLALERLAWASKDRRLYRLLQDMKGLLMVATRPPRPQRFIADLSQWLEAFAAMLPDAGARAPIDQARSSMKPPPLLEFLAQVRGIGTTRLERLFAAGLFTPKALLSAKAQDVAAVTGMSEHLATRVIQATHRYVREQAHHSPPEDTHEVD